MLLKNTWSNWYNNSKQLLNVLRHMQGNYISALDIRFLTPAWPGYWHVTFVLLQNFPNVWRCLQQIHIFCLSSWARWNRPVLAKISSFSLRTSLDRWQLIRWFLTSSLHSDSRIKPLKPRDEPQFFPSLLFKKPSWDIINVSLTNDLFCTCFQRDTSSGDLKERTITLYTP